MESILEAIGKTPPVRLHRCAPANGAELWLKLEYRNPTGSMKDRMALAMIDGAERDGLIPWATPSWSTRAAVPVRRSRTRLPCEGLSGADRDRRLLHRGALAADAGTRRGARRDSVCRRAGQGDLERYRQHGHARRRARGAARPLRDRPIQQSVHHPGSPRQARWRDLGADRVPIQLSFLPLSLIDVHASSSMPTKGKALYARGKAGVQVGNTKHPFSLETSDHRNGRGRKRGRKFGTYRQTRKRKARACGPFSVAGAGFEPATSGL
jgi:Pyridoxal-phosphate dependent enzyme